MKINNAVHREAVGLFPFPTYPLGRGVWLALQAHACAVRTALPGANRTVPLGTHQNNRRTTVRTTNKQMLDDEQKWAEQKILWGIKGWVWTFGHGYG